MKTASNYARIINFLNTGKDSGIEEGCEEVLSYVVCRQERGDTTKISQLEKAGLFKLDTSPTDGRAKHIEVTAKGISYLESQNKKLQAALKLR